MSRHLNGSVIAKGNIAPINFPGTDETGKADIVNLYLDADERYRWYYEEGTPTAAIGRTIHSAMGAARLQWHNFELLEYRGRSVEPEYGVRIKDLYAADEAQAMRGAGASPLRQ